MVSFSVDFAPLTAWWLLALVCLPAVALIAWAVVSRTRGAVVRAGAAAALALAIANPVINEEERAPLSTVVPVIVDRSQSQNIGGRTETADAALEALRERLARFPQFEVREVEAGMKAIQPSAGIELDPLFSVDGLKPEENGEAEALVRSITGDNATHVVSYGTEAGQFQSAGYSAVVCGPGDIAQAHQPNEFITVAQFEAGVAFMDKLVRRLQEE